jgi:hypothetical protein
MVKTEQPIQYLHVKLQKNKLHHQEHYAMTQAVTCQPLNKEHQIQSLVSPCGICDGQSGTGTSVFPGTKVFPPISSIHQRSTLSHSCIINTTLSQQLREELNNMLKKHIHSFPQTLVL